MAIGCLEGIVLAADARYKNSGPENPNIFQVGDRYAALVEPSVQAGTRLLNEVLAEEPEDGFSNLAHVVSIAGETGRRIREDAQQTPSTGIIFCGLDYDSESPPFPQVYGIHSSRSFQPRGFLQNAFGGSYHSIARYLGERITRQRPTIESAKYFAALALVATRGALGTNLEPYGAFATITVANGFSWLEQEEVDELMKRTSIMFSRLPTQLNQLFLTSDNQESSGVYRLEPQ